MKVLADVAHSFTMESGPGGRRCRPSHSTGLLCSSWRRRTNCLQGALMFITFTAHFQWVASHRNGTLVVPTESGAWNKALYKTEGRCSIFHDNATQSYFYHWPEDDPGFDHCCWWDEVKFTNFTYVEFGPTLIYATYYDLGLIDKWLPYWRCLHDLFDRMFETKIYSISCEITDLRKLYKRRFFSDTLFKRGLLQSALPLILFSEILVILSIALYCRFIRRRRPRFNESRDIMLGASKTWLRNIRKTVLMDWTHLCLLAITGSGLIDAVGRQDPYKSQSKLFYNYGILYVVLSILVACSSVLHQITFWVAEMDKAADDSQTTADLPIVTSGESISSRHASKPAGLEEKIGLNDDWKWQPIAAQAGILFCLSGFLTYPNYDIAADTAEQCLESS